VDKIKEDGGQGFNRKNIEVGIKIEQFILLFKDLVLYTIISAFFSMIFAPIINNLVIEIGFQTNLHWINMWYLLLIGRGFRACIDVSDILQQEFIIEEGGIDNYE